MSGARRDPSSPVDPSEILVARRGPGANCSSIGSALDVLFLSSVAAGAVLVAIAAAFGKQRGSNSGGSGAGASAPPTKNSAAGEASEPASPPMRARAEPFGAWVRADDSTLVAITRAAAERLGVEPGARWEESDGPPPLSPPLEVHLAVTSRCGAGCKGCYLDATADGEQPSFEVIEARLRAIAAAGAFTVAFGGGEPLSRPDLGELGALARELGLVPVVTTSGIGMTRERAEGLRSFAQVNVSYDGDAAGYALVRGWDGARTAERAMKLLSEAGVPFGANVVLTRSTFPRLEETIARLDAMGALEAQLLRYKPAGRAKSPDYLASRLAPDQARALLPTLERIAARAALRLRVDCALVPFLSAAEPSPALLARFGVLGCEAGRHLAAVRVDGVLAPCSFAPGARADVRSAWPSAERGGWESDALLAAWRAPHEMEPCRSCPLREVCRGGCRVVAQHMSGELAPDPECPRVLAHRAGRGEGAQQSAASPEGPHGQG